MKKISVITSAAVLFLSGQVHAQLDAQPAAAKPLSVTAASTSPTVSAWMSEELGQAWRQGYQGQGATITVVDDFSSQQRFSGNLSGTLENLRHGQWTSKEASMVAPRATMRGFSLGSNWWVPLNSGFNVINLSYGMMGSAGPRLPLWTFREYSILGYAWLGMAVVSKSAGNDYATAVGQANSKGQVDFLARDLIGARSAIFVGALDKNGTPSSPATMAAYSNVAGADPRVQQQFLVVGVEGDKTGLYGTSFAAPVVSGYAAVLHSKFTRSSPTQVTQQLLKTARQDTIAGYSPAIHGRGEASIARALAPASIR